MKKNKAYRPILVYICILYTGMTFVLSGQIPFKQTKKPFVYRYHNQRLEQTTTGAPFELSLTQKQFIEAQNPKGNMLLGMFHRIPLIGHYADPYDLRKLEILIDLPCKHITRILKPETQKALKHQFSPSTQPLQKQLAALDIQCLFTAFSLFALHPELTTHVSHNILYHTWLGTWHQRNRRMQYFNESIRAGIFTPIGLKEQAQFPFNTLSNQLVHYHNGSGDAFSPNNMKFFVPINHQYSFFISIALSQDKTKMSINNVLLANTPDAAAEIAYSAQQADNLDQLISKLKTIQQKTLNDALAQWINNLQLLLTPQAQNFRQLSHQLIHLNRQYNQ